MDGINVFRRKASGVGCLGPKPASERWLSTAGVIVLLLALSLSLPSCQEFLTV